MATSVHPFYFSNSNLHLTWFFFFSINEMSSATGNQFNQTWKKLGQIMFVCLPKFKLKIAYSEPFKSILHRKHWPFEACRNVCSDNMSNCQLSRTRWIVAPSIRATVLLLRDNLHDATTNIGQGISTMLTSLSRPVQHVLKSCFVQRHWKNYYPQEVSWFKQLYKNVDGTIP